MISERTLKRWRKESLRCKNVGAVGLYDPDKKDTTIDDLHSRILVMSQELLDQHLLKRR